MLPLHLAPGLLVTFMVLLAVIPLTIVWLDERRARAVAGRLVRLRRDVSLRETLFRQARSEAGSPIPVSLPEG